MNLGTIKTKVKSNTGISATRVETIIDDRIDEVQDLFIIKNVYKHKWSWLTSYAALNTTATYATGTVAITQDSTTVTGSGAVFTSGMVGRIIKFGSEDEYYTISAIDTGTMVITLDKAYIGATAAASTYTIYKVYYTLESDVKNINYFKQVVTPRPVLPVAELPFSKILPDEFYSSGEIEGYILSGMDSSGLIQVRFTPIPTTRKRIYYGYNKKFGTCATDATTTSSIPTDLHPLFIHKLSSFVYAAYDMASKAEYENNVFDAMLFNAVNEDKDLQMDSENVMEDEYVGNVYKARPQLPDEYPKIY